MRNYQTIEAGQANLGEHRAVAAWVKLSTRHVSPTRVVILKPEDKTSSVYRLEGLGPNGAAVIAKRKRIRSIALELVVYREMFPRTALRTLNCYGFTDDPDPTFGWLFLEDAGDQRYDFNHQGHRALAAEWFAMLHTGLAQEAMGKYWLPIRGLEYWHSVVSLACDTIRLSFSNPAFSGDDLAILRAILSYGESILLHWNQVKMVCQAMPETLVHGDFCPKNVRVRAGADTSHLFPIDWDCAGWGIAAADLSHTDILVYWSAVRRQWPSLALDALRSFANVGRMFWALDPITGEGQTLASDWVGNVMRKMRFYCAELEAALRIAGWHLPPVSVSDTEVREQSTPKLLPDVLKERWQAVEENRFTKEEFGDEQEKLFEEYRNTWAEALMLEGSRDLKESLLKELASYTGCRDKAEIEGRCSVAWRDVEDEWHERVKSGSSESIERFYDHTQAYLYNLIWWHSLCEEDTPLAYVLALRFAQSRDCSRYLDFGAGASSGTILFARHGFDSTSADISSSLLRFSAWRLDRRGLNARITDLKHQTLPSKAFDFVTAMDVFEHLVDPVAAVDQIAEALVPGGFLYGRFACREDDERPQHIVHDFEPVFERLRALGFSLVWEDDWLWGHQVFQKPSSGWRTRSGKNTWTDLAIFGGQPAFPEQLHVGRPNIGNRSHLQERIDGALSRRWLTNNGVLVQELERRISEFIGVKHCIATCNGTVGLEIAVRSLGLTGEVIVPSFTFVATAHALQWLNITPVFCDVDPRTHNIDPQQIERLITSRTTGIIGVHLWGRACDVDALAEIAARHRVALLFDAAHAFACSHHGRMMGNFGNLEVFSFHATKFFHTFEGGAIVTGDDTLAATARAMRNFGFSSQDDVIDVGTNGKMSEASAAMGLTGLECLDEFVATNYSNYKHYQTALAGLPGIRLLSCEEKEKLNYQYVVLEVDETVTHVTRDQMLEVLHAENVLARRYFHPGCHRVEPYRSLFPELRLPVTEILARRVLVLPTGTAINAAEVRGISEIIRLLIENSAMIRERLAGRAELA
jgi:dTDP-4-amino-4,6-dideoxygalactose transaminase/2-polyprenyl-3-methyl-5-hydroxy-6-metoxy-1,4-benzoquinol methylase